MNRRQLLMGATLLLMARAAQAAPTSHGLQGGAHHAGHPGTTSRDNVGGGRNSGGEVSIGGQHPNLPGRRSPAQIRRQEGFHGQRGGGGDRAGCGCSTPQGQSDFQDRSHR